jgi:Flp pilus assembly protein TadD
MSTYVITHSELLVTARAAYGRHDWRDSYDGYVGAGAVAPLGVDDLDAMAVAAWRIGNVREATRIAELVFTRRVRTDPGAAALTAVDLGVRYLTRGDLASARGWLERARLLLGAGPRLSSVLGEACAAIADGRIADARRLLAERPDSDA